MPFVGESGQDLDRIIAEAGLPSNEFFFTNVVNEQPYGNEMTRFFYSNAEVKSKKLEPLRGLYPRPNVLAGLAKLRELIDILKPKLIIGFGNYALWALTEASFNITNSEGFKVPSGISSWRGSQLFTSPEFGSIPFLPTYHPAAALRTYPWRYMIVHDLKARASKILAGMSWKEPPLDFTVRPSFEQTTQFLQNTLCQVQSAPTRIVLDLETRAEHIACCGLALSKTSAFCTPFMQIGTPCNYWSITEESFIVSLFRSILLHPNCILEGQNLLYDVQYLFSEWGIIPRIDFDSMIAHHVCFPGGGDPSSPKAALMGVQQKSLANLSSLYCEHHYYWKDEGKNWESAFSEEQLWTYNCRDCVKTFEVIDTLRGLVADFNLEPQVRTQLRIANDMLLPMMLRGTLRNEQTRRNHAFLLSAAELDFDDHLDNLLPASISARLEESVKAKKSAPWYNSPTKLATLFYDILAIKPVYNQQGRPTTAKQALPVIAAREPLVKPVVERIEIRRSLSVFYNTFIELPSDPDGRVRSAYKLTGTDTFRLASSENAFGRGGNLQNIPGGKETTVEINFKFPNVRQQFIPDTGYELAEFDLSGADAQTVAWEANDADLKSAFRAGLKLHLKNARDVYPDKTRDMTDEEIAKLKHDGGLYSNVKKLAHGTNFGGTAKGLAERVRVKVTDVEEFQERWFSLHPGIKQWHIKTQQKLQGMRCWKCEEVIHGAKICPVCNAFPQGRIIGNKFGYRIVYFDRISELFNAALAWTPQSTTAINCNLGALALVERVPWVQLLMQVHDSLIVQYPIRYSDRLGDIKAALHSVTVPYEDPLTIPWSCAVSRKSWGDAEEVKW